MPINNTLKKMIIFSSHKRRKTIEGIIKDQAALSGKSESAIIEHALMQVLMPEDQNVQYWIADLYDGGYLSTTYANVFSCFAAGLNWQARWSNGRPLVDEFCKNLATTFPKISGNETELNHLISQLNTIYNLHSDIPHAQEVKHYWSCYIKQLQEAPDQISLLDLVSLILQSWEWIGNHTATYRALADLAKISAPHFHDDSSSRYRFISTIRQVSSEWRN